MVLVELLQRIVWLWDADGSDIVVEPCELTITVRVEDNQGNVVPAVSAVLAERIKLVVLDYLLDSEGKSLTKESR